MAQHLPHYNSMGHEAGYLLTTLLHNRSQETHWLNPVPHSTGSVPDECQKSLTKPDRRTEEVPCRKYSH